MRGGCGCLGFLASSACSNNFSILAVINASSFIVGRN
jgi:hypothetical protein